MTAWYGRQGPNFKRNLQSPFSLVLNYQLPRRRNPEYYNLNSVLFLMWRLRVVISLLQSRWILKIIKSSTFRGHLKKVSLTF